MEPLRNAHFVIDRQSSVPIGLQIKGQIEYGIACGDLLPGAQLPPVREIAVELGVSPVTISQVYGDLQKAGLLAAQPGRGTFVARSPGLRLESGQQLHFEALVDQLVAEARRLDFNNEQILNRVATQLSRYPTGLKPVNVALVGLFEEATRAYAESLRRQLTNLARIEWFTFRDLEHQDARAQLDGYDLFVTFPHLLMTLKELVPDALVTDLGLLPSEHTRVSLAELDPRSRVLAISTFAEFLATLKKGISKFAPHLNDIHFVVLDESNPKELPAGCDLATYDVVVYATGSERIRELLPRTTRVFEYRHVPDSVFVDEQLAPILRKLRAGEPVDGPL